jgi:phage gpG-like protein
MAIKTLADVHARWNDAKVKAQVQRMAGKGIKAAGIFFASRVKELLSVPAPRKLVHGKRGASAGLVYYRATVAATRGAPPRKLSGKLRMSITTDASADGSRVRVGTNIVYARRHELGVHPFLVPTLRAMRSNLAAIVGQPYRAGVS